MPLSKAVKEHWHTRSYYRYLTGSVVKATTCAYFHLWIFRSIFSGPFPPTYYDCLFINASSSIPHTRSPFVPRLPWLAMCSKWNFLWDMGGVHRKCVGFIGYGWGSSHMCGVHRIWVGFIGYVWGSSDMCEVHRICVGFIAYGWGSSDMGGVHRIHT
jgi:hypothetical protein